VITRRKLLLALTSGTLAAPLASFAQQQRSRVARIGLLEPGSASGYVKGAEALIAGLRELGLVEGKNIIMEYRWAEGKYERLPALAAELAQMKVDVIVAVAAAAIQAAQNATTMIPIVMLRIGDPVAAGFVASLARPGRNITGLSNMNPDVMSKYLELLRAAVPKLSRAVVLAHPGNPTHSGYVARIQAAGKTNGVTILPAQASTESEIEALFAATKQQRPGALIVLPDTFFYAQTRQIAELALQQRLPTMFATREPVEAGALMSYGQDILENYHRAATYVDKILKGAKPGDLPVEQATKFEFVINLKTAKAIGLTIPQDLLLRADKVIE
jgi:putative ABC transport system substrate-binding protein